MTETIVEIKGLSYTYGAGKALSDINLHINKGDFLGIIGPNGSGKTTLMKLMLGIYPMQSGNVRLFGSRIQEFREWHRIGYVPQNATNIDRNFPANVEEVVTIGVPKKGLIAKVPSFRSKAVAEALHLVNMGSFAKRKIGELSGGQQQRVFIAKAIALRPDIIFLDEPTTGIDSETQANFYKLLHELNTKQKMTIVLISHDTGAVTQYATKVACLNQKLVFHGTHDDFCASDVSLQFLTKDQHLLCHRH
jgi:zinc transport system ATP-binding protein